ncbi:hypothetical protein QJS04_geneDACA004210 [Acorus gramineus]|uniref:Methyltransferase type 11 domain-containing protein n=1 Tax=Acorus gramineus TaxID=55184 RepID=A0AAV9B3R3_ACOGR|nr:hypothetical protein QJS04_geneDACA004210 [Acorus gramineus]
MKNLQIPIKPLLLLTLSLSASLSLISLLHHHQNYSQNTPPTPTIPTTPLRVRRNYSTYDAYLHIQLNKTLNPSLRHLWTTRDWDRKVRVFSSFFRDLLRLNLLIPSSRCLCVGARVGQEVQALISVGVPDAIGIDLVASPPLVVEGDFHRQPFEDERFDFEFSNVFDHALYPERFVAEIERTLKVGGIAAVHVAIGRRGDKYSANDLFSVDGLVGLFRVSEVVRVRRVDGFGLDTEVVMRKVRKWGGSNAVAV